jgi:two-component system LytT family sensor kinase
MELGKRHHPSDNEGMFEGRRQWYLYWGAWGLLSVYYFSWDVFWYFQSPSNTLSIRSILILAAMNLAQNAAWALIGLVLLALVRRFPIESFSWRAWKALCIHLVSGLVLTVVGLLASFFIALATDGRLPVASEFLWRGFRNFFFRYFHTNYLIMLVLVGAYHMVLVYRRYRKREVEAAQLEKGFVEAQNQALRMQLQPHFLFNTLNSISALVHLNPDTADQMITKLADLLRISLEQSGQQEVPLSMETLYLERYLAIERIRFQDRLTVAFDIPESLRRARVPSFVLQPLVENAIKHGVNARSTGGHIAVRARAQDGQLCLEVEDDGPGFITPTRPGGGIGTANTRRRLQLLYGEKQSFELQSIPGKGTLARVCLPLTISDSGPLPQEAIA